MENGLKPRTVELTKEQLLDIVVTGIKDLKDKSLGEEWLNDELHKRGVIKYKFSDEQLIKGFDVLYPDIKDSWSDERKIRDIDNFINNENFVRSNENFVRCNMLFDQLYEFILALNS